jgi:hypothetical protein
LYSLDLAPSEQQADLTFGQLRLEELIPRDDSGLPTGNLAPPKISSHGR